MKQKCHLQIGVTQHENAAMPLSTSGIPFKCKKCTERNRNTDIKKVNTLQSLINVPT